MRLWRVSALVILVFLLSMTCVSVPAKAQIGVTDITPTFYSLQIYPSNGHIIVKAVVFDYNSWHSIAQVIFEAKASNNATVESVLFQQYGTNGTISDSFSQTAGRHFDPAYSAYYSSNLTDTISERCNMTVIFALTPMSADYLTISVIDIHGKVASSDMAVQSGYIGSGMVASSPLLVGSAAAATLVAVLMKSRKAWRNPGAFRSSYAVEDERP